MSAREVNYSTYPYSHWRLFKIVFARINFYWPLPSWFVSMVSSTVSYFLSGPQTTICPAPGRRSICVSQSSSGMGGCCGCYGQPLRPGHDRRTLLKTLVPDFVNKQSGMLFIYFCVLQIRERNMATSIVILVTIRINFHNSNYFIEKI